MQQQRNVVVQDRQPWLRKRNAEAVRLKLIYSTPATRRVYASVFRAPQWHRATQTHFPPRPRKSARCCDITDVISPHGLPTHNHTIPSIIPLTSDTPRLHHVSRSPVARCHVNALPTKAAQIRLALRHHGVIWPRFLPTHYKQSYHTIPPIFPLTSDTPRLHQRVSCPPVARRHVNTMPAKAAQIRMALRHHGRNLAMRSAHTLQAILSHDTANHPAHQRQAAFTPACFALPSGTAPRKRTCCQGRANPHGTAASRM